jgi:hypothetical protein
LASNWVLVGETKGFGKQGKKFEFHGQKKRVFLYELDKRFIKSLSPHLQRPPQTEQWESIMEQIANVDYHSTILESANLTPDKIQEIDLFFI